MPRFLALDWDAGHAYLVAANVAKGAVKIETALAWAEEAPPAGAAAAGFGQRLKDRLKEAKVAPAPLLVAVGRDRVVVKDVKIPAVPPHEEPAIVRFQAMKELTEAVEDVVLDYFMAGDPEPSGERKAFVVALRKDQLAAWKAVAAAAGLKLAGVTPRAFATIAALRRTAQPAPDTGTAFAALAVTDKGGEFVVARGEQLALARPLSAAARTTDAALVGEIRRNLAVYAGQAGQQPVRAVYVAEDAARSLGVADRLRDTLAVPVYAFDPLAGLADAPPGPRGGFAGAAGLIHLRARAAELPVNFVHPREPKPPRDPNKRAMAWAGVAAAVVLGTLAAVGYAQLSAQNKRLRDLRVEKEDVEQNLLALAKDDTRNQAVDTWLKSEVVWLDELYDMAARWPDVDKLRLTQVNVKPSANTGKNTRFTALMDLKGLATDDQKPLTALRNALDQDGAYAVGPIQPKANTSFRANRGQFSQEWSTTIGVAKRAPGDYQRKLTAKAPPRKGQKAASRNADDAGQGGDQ